MLISSVRTSPKISIITSQENVDRTVMEIILKWLPCRNSTIDRLKCTNTVSVRSCFERGEVRKTRDLFQSRSTLYMECIKQIMNLFGWVIIAVCIIIRSSILGDPPQGTALAFLTSNQASVIPHSYFFLIYLLVFLFSALKSHWFTPLSVSQKKVISNVRCSTTRSLPLIGKPPKMNWSNKSPGNRICSGCAMRINNTKIIKRFVDSRDYRIHLSLCSIHPDAFVKLFTHISYDLRTSDECHSR